MRIAMVGSRGIPPQDGGVERVVAELTAELTAAGHEVIVYSRRNRVLPGQGPSAGTSLFTPGLGGKHFETITHTASSMFDVLRRGVDVVHVHSPGPALCMPIPAATGKPTVLTIHAPDWRRDKWSWPAKVALRAGLWLGMKLASAVTSVSEPLAEELTGVFGRQVHYVPNGVRSVRRRPPRAIARWGLRRDGYVLYVGRIVPEKRLDVLLEAWARLARPELLVVAGGSCEKRYFPLCRALAPGNVLFVGPQYGDMLAELYSNAALVVLPSALEGMSLALLEAAAYGRCILAADIPANVAAMGDSILYFNCQDVGELGRQMRRCLEQSKLRLAMGRKARARAISRYSWSAAAQSFELIYRKVMQSGWL